MTLGKDLTALNFGIVIYEEVAVTTHCISARDIGVFSSLRISLVTCQYFTMDLWEIGCLPFSRLMDRRAQGSEAGWQERLQAPIKSSSWMSRQEGVHSLFQEMFYLQTCTLLPDVFSVDAWMMCVCMLGGLDECVTAWVLGWMDRQKRLK